VDTDKKIELIEKNGALGFRSGSLRCVGRLREPTLGTKTKGVSREVPKKP
jgi:hypothetical protein